MADTASSPTPRETWLAARKGGIGSSEIGVILGLNPWKSAFQLWAEKSGVAEPRSAETEAAEWGTRLEPLIAAKYTEETGRAVSKPTMIRQHPTYPFLLASLDYEIQPMAETLEGPVTPPGVLECKTASLWKADEWLEEPPLLYQVQHEYQLLVTGYLWGSLAVLIGGQRFYYQDRQAHPATHQLMVEEAERFWDRVQSGNPPPVDGSPMTKELLARMYPKEQAGESTVLPAEATEWDEKRREGLALIQKGEALKNEAENLLRAAMGNAEIGVFPDGKTWYSSKQQTRKSYTVQETTFRRMYRHELKRLHQNA